MICHSAAETEATESVRLFCFCTESACLRLDSHEVGLTFAGIASLSPEAEVAVGVVVAAAAAVFYTSAVVNDLV